MPKPYDLNLHKSYNVNNNDKNYKSFTDGKLLNGTLLGGALMTKINTNK